MGIELEVWIEELLYTEYLDMTPEEYLRTPCINVCKTKLDKDELICKGCYRTLEQIKQWFSYTDQEKEEQLKLIKQRRG